MEIIEQTNRTILFEEISPEKLDLLTLIGDVKGLESLDDDKIKEINGYLLVRSFDEFLDKFQPTIYSFFNAANQKVIYTLKKPEAIPEDCLQAISLDGYNDVLSMLLSMIQAKGGAGVANVDFKFEKILALISPTKVMDDIRASRKEIHYLYSEYEKLDEEAPARLDVGDKLNAKFEEASKHYNNIMAMLPLAIDDCKQRLLAGGNDDALGGEAFIAGQLTMGDDGELKILEIPKADSTELMNIEEQASNALLDIFKEDYESVNDNPSEYMSELVTRVFCPLPVTSAAELNIPKEVEKYNHYLSFYKESKDGFIKAAKPLLEKLLGVYIFFDQYKSKSKGMMPSLLVCNNTLEMLTKSHNMPRLQVFLNTVNNKIDYTNTIWFGIVGNIEYGTKENVRLTRERFKGNQKVVKSDLNAMANLTSLLQGILEYQVQTFFSFETGEDTSFSSLATKGVDDYLEKTRPLGRQEYSEYAIPCIPNMSIVPRNKSGVVLDRFMVASENGAALSQDEKDMLKLWIEGVYIPACYVAAGLTAACQCPEYLRNRFKSVSRDFPGVRFDFESSDNALRVPTTLGKEISGYTNRVKEAINQRNFGFVFSSDNYQVDAKETKQITVYKARSMKSGEFGYESLYMTLTSTYIRRMLRARSGDNKLDNVEFFFSANPKSQKSIWASKKEFVNSIMQPSDELMHTIDLGSEKCAIDMNFGGNSINLEVELNKAAKIV
jgi:hypothetical protein